MSGSFAFSAAFLAGLCLRASVILVVAMLATWLLRRRSAALRHLVWVGAFSGLLALPLMGLALPGWRVIPGDWMASFRADASTQSAAPVVRPAPSPGAVDPIRLSETGLLAGMWVTGFVLLLLRIPISHFWLRGVIRRGDVVAAGPLCDALDELQRELGVCGSVQLVSAPTGPMACGMIWPIIVVPQDATEWTESQQRSVLLHELAHVIRRDPLSKLLIEIGRAAYWFHPLTWWAAGQAGADRERACDDLALRSGVPAVNYARHLLDVATAGRLKRLAPGLAMASPNRLDRRLRSIMDAAQDRRPMRRSSVVLTLAAGTCLLAPISMLRPEVTGQQVGKPADSVLRTDDRSHVSRNEVDVDQREIAREAARRHLEVMDDTVALVDAELLAQAQGCLTRQYLILEALAKQEAANRQLAAAAPLESRLQAAR